MGGWGLGGWLLGGWGLGLWGWKNGDWEDGMGGWDGRMGIARMEIGRMGWEDGMGGWDGRMGMGGWGWEDGDREDGGMGDVKMEEGEWRREDENGRIVEWGNAEWGDGKSGN